MLVILVILVYTKIDKLLEYSKLKVLDNVGVLVLNLIINGDLGILWFGNGLGDGGLVIWIIAIVNTMLPETSAGKPWFS